MNLDAQLEALEETGQTEAERIDEMSAAHDVEDAMYSDEDDGDDESDADGLEEVYEMELDEDDVYAYLVDEDDNEIGFVLIDENGDEQQYLYVDMDDYEVVDADEAAAERAGARAAGSSDEDDFDLGITREGVAEATSDMNVIYKEGAEVAAEFKQTIEEINESMSFLRKR